jgi:two-component system cell cycle sensor histidine kinase/response regulator CckA
MGETRHTSQMRDARAELSDPGDDARLQRLIFDQLPDGIVLVDGEGRWLYGNRVARDPEGVAFRLLSEGLTADGELAEMSMSLHATGEATVERSVRDGAGFARQVLVNGTRVAHDRYAIVARDVTERRESEAELGQLRRVESLGFLTASVVHDFNNLLTPIVCLSSILTRELERSSRAGEIAGEIRETAERAAGLVRQMLSFVRRGPERAGRTNLGSVVAEMQGLLRRVAGDGVELVLAIDEDAGDVVVDRGQLEHVLLNLAANARDAMPHGGRLFVATTPITFVGPDALDAELRPEQGASGMSGAYVALRVSDTGIGMSPQVRERAFERFFTTKGHGAGSGLGLAAAQRFARASGGCISVRSAEGIGTTITLCLPRADEEASAPPPSHELLPRGSETILVVEDDDAVRSVVRALLEAQGYVVLDASSGRAAIELAAKETRPIDLLITDVVMPEMSGRALADALGAEGMGITTRVLFMSGHTDKVIEERGVDEAAAPLLRKAFSPAQLLLKVREVLGVVAA